MAFAKLIVFGMALVLLGTQSPVFGNGKSEATATDSAATDTTLSVDALAKSPKSFAGREIMVSGVVATVVSRQKVFTIIDQSEFEECNAVTCARYEIPIDFDGKLPEPKQVIVATGRLVQPQPGRFLFKAKRVEIRK